MKNLAAGVAVCLCVACVIAICDRAEAEPAARSTELAMPSVPAPQALAKKCSFNSDCHYGKCKRHRCGGCSFQSDCKGWGKCKKGWCGGCSFQSDCKGFGKCSHGHCTKSPY